MLLIRCWPNSRRSTRFGGLSRPTQITFEELDWTMACHEYDRLRQHYEASLRHWGHVLLSSGAEPTGAPARLAAEVKQKALEERNAANDRMCLHKLNCPVWNPKLKANHSSRYLAARLK
jgi:hypothetical protein